MRPRILWIGLAALAALAVVAGLTLVNTTSGGPVASERIVGIGFEDVVAGGSTMSKLDQRLNDVRATGVSLGVGRIDWTAFPWPEHSDEWSSPVRDSNRDYVAEAIKAVGTNKAGKRRDIIAVIDVLVSGLIAHDPSVAGVSAHGVRSTSSPSVASLQGEVGDRLISLVESVSERYKPSAISLTELFLDTYTFGHDDLHSYRAATGKRDWPRTSSGAIDTGDPSIGKWRSQAVTALVKRAAAAAHAHGVKLLMEVRASWSGPHTDPGQDGQDYEALLSVADRLVVWGYFGLNKRPPEYLQNLAQELPASSRKRFIMSVGVWAEHGSILPGDLATAARAGPRGGVNAVWVTPTSLMDDGLWSALRGEWGTS
jgi:hypothetical protein